MACKLTLRGYLRKGQILEVDLVLDSELLRRHGPLVLLGGLHLVVVEVVLRVGGGGEDIKRKMRCWVHSEYAFDFASRATKSRGRLSR